MSVIGWPEKGPNHASQTFGAYERIPVSSLAGGLGGNAPLKKTSESAAHRAIVWAPIAKNATHALVFFHGWGAGVRTRANSQVTDIEYYALPTQLPLLREPCVVVLPQGGTQGEFGSAMSDPIGYLQEIRASIPTLTSLSLDRILVAAHSGGGYALGMSLPRLGAMCAGALTFEAINGPREAARLVAWAKSVETSARFVYGEHSNFYAPTHRALQKALAERENVHFEPVHSDHLHCMSVDNVLAMQVNAILTRP